MKKKQKKLRIGRLRTNRFIIIFVFFHFSLFADTLDDASEKERDGNLEIALVLYDNWLSMNTSDSRFSEILFYRTSLEVSIEKSLEILLSYEQWVVDNKKQGYYLRIAELYELIFNIQEASFYYEKAFNNIDGTRNIATYVRYLHLRYQLGDIPDINSINNILLGNIDTVTYVNALLLKSEILKHNNEFDSALLILINSEYKNLYPEIMLAIWDLYIWKNDLILADTVFQSVKKIYPDSIEYKIMKGDIKKISKLSDFFYKNQICKSYVQVGAFQNKTNADILCDNLRISGFSSLLINENKTIKVIVEDIIPANELLHILEKKGYKGFIINYL